MNNENNTKKTNNSAVKFQPLQKDSLIPVRYLHLRQVCNQQFFKSKQIDEPGKIGKGRNSRTKISFVSSPVEATGLHVEVVTPLLINQNRMLKDLPIVVEVLFKGKPVYKWRTLVYWQDDGRLFLNELTAAVGRALRISHTCFIKDDSETAAVAAEIAGSGNGRQKENSRNDNYIKIPRPAVERYL